MSFCRQKDESKFYNPNSGDGMVNAYETIMVSMGILTKSSEHSVLMACMPLDPNGTLAQRDTKGRSTLLANSSRAPV